MTTSSHDRFGWVYERRVFIYSAVLAADAAAARGRGFGAADVRFFFLLFTNWVEHDVLHPEQELELTQVRRVLERLVRNDHASRVRSHAQRGARYTLGGEGVLRLASAISDGIDEGRPFEEILFIICFASSYGPAIRAKIRALGEGRAGSKQLAALFDARVLVARARRRLRALVLDLEERIASGLDLAAEAAKAKGEDDAIQRIETRGSYQLQRVRPLRELLRALPPDVRRFELSEGIAFRVRVLFEPLLARTRIEIDRLEAVAAITLRA